MSAAIVTPSACWSLEPEPLAVPACAWEELARGYLRVQCEEATPDWLHLIARVQSAPKARDVLTAGEAETLLRVLCGEQLKVIGLDSGLAPSTVSERCTRAIRRLSLAGRAVPLAVVVAAQCSAGLIEVKAARRHRFVEHGAAHVMLSVPRPEMHHVPDLGVAERDVARLLIEGLSPAGIADRRGSSVHTVANQRQRVFSVLRVCGRYGLIRRAAELGCFD